MRRNARKRFRASERTRCSLVKIARRNHYGLGESNSSSRRKFRVRGSLSTGESDWEKSGRHRTVGQSSQEFSPRSVGCPRKKTFRGRSARSKILSTRLLFRAGPKVKRIGRRPRAFRTRAPSRTYAFDDAHRAHARVPHDFVRARIHPHVAGTRHRPIVGRPSVRVAGAFSRVLIHDAGARPDGPRDRPHARARARERQGDQPRGRRTDRAGTASSVLRGASRWREARANSKHRPKSCTMPRHAERRFSDCARANRNFAREPTRLPRTDRRTHLSLRFLRLMIRLTSRFDPPVRETTKRSAEPRAFRLNANPPNEVRSA